VGGAILIRNVDSERSTHSSVNPARYAKVLLYYVKARSNVYIFAFTTLVSLFLGSHGSVDLRIAFSAISASYFLALATYMYNDVTDFKVDRINKSNRPAATGKVTKGELVTLVSILYGSALLLAASMNLHTALVATVFAALGITYSHPKIDLKERFPLKTVVTAVGAGLSSLLGGTAVSSISMPVIYTTLFFFVFFFILGPLGDIADLRGDRAVGRRTFPIALGMTSTIFIMLSVPVVIIAITILTYSISGIGMLGTSAIIGICVAIFAFLLKISKRTTDVSWIKATRPKMRFLYVLLQLSLLLSFLQ
jgi:4-hydroxybenzoate polyprenyltransferase